MREILVRSLTSANRTQRDCLVTERIDQGECRTSIVRRCTYRVESQTAIPATEDSIQWAKSIEPHRARQVFVTKHLDPLTGEERVVYKVLGHFYVVMDCIVFCIGYRHILSMDIGSDDPADLDT